MAQMTTTVHTLSDILHIIFYQLAKGSRRNWERSPWVDGENLDQYSIKCCPLKEGTISAFFNLILPTPSTDPGMALSEDPMNKYQVAIIKPLQNMEGRYDLANEDTETE